MKRKGQLLLVVAVIGILLFITSKVSSNGGQPTKESAIWVEQQGEVIKEQQGQQPLPIASLSKVMVGYLLFEALEETDLNFQSEVTIPIDFMKRYSHLSGLATVHLEVGQSYTIRQLAEAMLIPSANDATVAIAYALANDEEQFVAKMNAKAKALGLSQTQFVNATGLTVDGQYNVSSARDLATLTSLFIEKYPEVLTMTSMPKTTAIHDMTYWSTNHLLKGMPHQLEGVDGFKTGFTEDAGHCLITTGERNGKRFVTVVLNASEGDPKNKNSKFVLTESLLQGLR